MVLVLAHEDFPQARAKPLRLRSLRPSIHKGLRRDSIKFKSNRIPLHFDWTSWYLSDEEDMAQGPVHFNRVTDFVSLLRVFARERNWKNIYVGGDAFWGWVKEHPLVRISPDAYIVDDPPEPLPESWCTWLPKHSPPRFAMEIVSSNWKKDYELNPQKYDQLGVLELAIFDANALKNGKRTRSRGTAARVPLQLYRRDAEGALLKVFEGLGPVYSEELDAYLLVLVSESGEASLRLALDKEGKELVLTQDERLEAERIARQEEAEARKRETEARKRETQARKAAEHKAKREESSRKNAEKKALALKAELTALKAELSKLRKK